MVIGYTSSKKSTTPNNLSLSEIANLQIVEKEIVRIDDVLERIHQLFPNNPQVHIFSARVSDALFELQQALHGLDISDFTGKTRGQEAS